MAAENYAEGLRAILNVVSNPQALRQIQRLPGAAADQVRDALKTFQAAAGSGSLGPAIQRKVLFPNAPTSRPIPTQAEKATQLPLPLRTQSGRPVTSTTPRPTTRNAETIRIGNRERAVDMPEIRLPRDNRDQMSVFSAPEPQFKYGVPPAPRPEWGPDALPVSLRQADAETSALLQGLEPGTVSSLARLADDLSVEYGVPAGEALKNITGPQGTDYLAYLNTSRKMAPSPGGAGGGMVPGGASSMTPSRGGALVPSPGGALDDAARRAADAVIEADVRVLENAPQALSAVGSATTDLGRAVRQLGLTPTQIKALVGGGLGIGAGLGIGLLGREDREETSPDLRLTQDQLYPPQKGAAGASAAGARGSGADRRVPSIVGQTGSGQVVITQNDGESAYRQAAANAAAAARSAAPGAPGAPMAAPTADPNRSIADYYRARQQYVEQPGVAEDLIRQLSGMPGVAPQTPVWAAQNPALAYEMLQRAKARPDLSQQSPQIETMSVGTQLGDNNVNNAAANAAYGASAEVDRSSGAADLEDATRPLIRPKLNYVPLGGRFIDPTGVRPVTPFG
jgi:hypothetical protein